MINSNNDNYCVILAGGKGRRLWPCSRSRRPKQFVDFFSTGRTLLQSTFDRVGRFMPVENIYVSTNHEYAHYVLEQLPELPRENVLSEPIHRNTAPSVAWATYRIMRRSETARMVVVPSDQAVISEDKFVENILCGLDWAAENDRVLTIGVKPTRPEPGYGYLQVGEMVGEDLFLVKSFTEKPAREFARMFMESGEFYWNTGIYVSSVRHMVECLHRIFPEMLRRVDTMTPGASTLDDELLYIEENFPAYPNISIDFGLLENDTGTCMMKGDFGWSDLGMWHSIYESLSKGVDDNVVVGSNVMIEESRGNIIKLPKDHLGIINGLEGFIVAEEGNVLLICKKEDSSALIRKYISETEIKYGDEFV
jgi:mannose-1-phosphate guanylyltransferase